MLDVVRWLRKFGKERARELLAPHLHKYLDERILVSEWYPEADHIPLLRVLATLMVESNPGQAEDSYVLMGRIVARQNFSTIYAHLINPSDPEATLRLCTVWWLAYHDSGRCKVTIPRPGHATIVVSDFAEPYVELCKIHAGLYPELVRMSGAQEVRMVETQCCNRGAPSCVMELDWR